MPGSGPHAPAYRFGSYELDTRNGDLRKLGIRIKLQDQPRQILLLLLEHAGNVVTRDEIRNRLWPDNTFVDFDNAINSAIRKLRDALGDTAENPRFIETLPRRGYRFIAPVSTNADATAGPAPSPPVSDKKGRQSQFVAAAVAAVIVASALAARLVQTSSKNDNSDLRVLPLTANTGLEMQPSFSPDATRVAYVWNGRDRKGFGIYVKLIGAGDPMAITKDGRYFSPAWSPDGRWIAAIRDLGAEGAIVLIPASGGPYRELARVTKAGPAPADCISGGAPHVCGLVYWASLLAWSPDGKYLFASSEMKPGAPYAIVSISVETGEQRAVTAPVAQIYGDFGPAVSSNGRELAFVRLIGAKTGDLYAVPLDRGVPGSGEVKRITFDGADIAGLGWTPDGRALIFSSNRGNRHELWRTELTGKAAPRRLAGMGEDASDVAISSSTSRLAYTRGAYHGSLWKIPIEHGSGGAPIQVTATTARDKFSQFSPDGKRIAFQSGRSGVDEIWVCDADGANAIQLTSFGRGMSGSPRWSPDGRTIAFDSNVSGNWDVWLIGAQGGRPVRVTNNSANNFIPSWSHDGRWLYFTSSRSGRNEIWKTRPEGGPDVQVTTGGAFTAVESADGKELYYVRGPADVSELWRMPAGGGSASKVLDSVSGRLFSVTPRGIYFASGSPVMELRYLSFATGSVRSIAPIDGIAHADVSQDERWALYPKVEPTTSNIMLVENFRDR